MIQWDNPPQPPTLRRIVTPIARVSEDVRRECELVRKRAERPQDFTIADTLELLRLQSARTTLS